jgi:hypothetical protein
VGHGSRVLPLLVMRMASRSAPSPRAGLCMKRFLGSTAAGDCGENRTTYDDSAHRSECLISFGRRPGDCDNLERLEILSLSPHCGCLALARARLCDDPGGKERRGSLAQSLKNLQCQRPCVLSSITLISHDANQRS